MNLFEVVEKLKNCTDEREAYVLNSIIEEMAKGNKEELKPVIEDGELGTTSFNDLGKELNVIEMEKSTLRTEEIKAALSDEEIRKVYNPTLKDITTLKRKDLKDLKDVAIVRQVRVSTIKEINVA